jgi:hypothetical protein
MDVGRGQTGTGARKEPIGNLSLDRAVAPVRASSVLPFILPSKTGTVSYCNCSFLPCIFYVFFHTPLFFPSTLPFENKGVPVLVFFVYSQRRVLWEFLTQKGLLEFTAHKGVLVL